MYDDGHINSLQVDILASAIAKYDLPRFYAAFEWSDARLPEAWRIREDLQAAASNLSRGDLENWAHRVHKWGFGSSVPKRIREHPRYVEALKRTIAIWRKPGLTINDREPKTRSLAELLSIPHLGIARASKWICFLSQEQYAIYDSRVSLALRDVHLDGKRVFPIVGRKSLRGAKAWHPDPASGQPRQMAEMYWSYLKVVNRVTELIQHGVPLSRAFYPAEIEMALFVIGDVWPDPASRKKLRLVGSE